MYTMTATSTCTSRGGRPRRAYPDRASATEGARYATATFGRRMVPYLCDRCGRWHLCPEDRHTPGHHCNACSKQSYETEAAAERRAEILLAERGVHLRVYDCPYGDGWHLTSRR